MSNLPSSKVETGSHRAWELRDSRVLHPLEMYDTPLSESGRFYCGMEKGV